jgi:tRNA-dihydrouridine synthase B
MKTMYNLTFNHGFFLAPLSGYTNWPLRMLCRKFGAELCYTEMISAAGMIRRTENTRKLLVRPDDDKPLVVQIFSESPEEASLAARMLEDEGFDGIDINMGCPVKKIVKKGAGAALMKDAGKALRMAEAVNNAVRVPVSVKMRAGWDTDSMNADELAPMFEKTGIDCLILHPRTRTDMYRGSPRWEIFSRVKAATSIPVVASGDIKSPEDIHAIRTIGADAYMVGRGVIGRPWIFRELTGGPPASLEERRDAMLHHLDMLCTCMGQRKGILHMRKFLSSYVRGLPGAAHFRKEACAMENFTQLQSLINLFCKREILC